MPVTLNLALLLSWTPPALTCRGTPETGALTYEVGYKWCFMHYGPECPLDMDGKMQPCRFCLSPVVMTAVPQATLPEPGLDEVIAYNLDWVTAVDSAGNRSDGPCN